MTYTPIKNAAGTQKERQQTLITQQCWTDTDGVHFPDGRLTTLPSFSEVSITSPTVSLDGYTRSIFAQRFDGATVGTGWLFGTNDRIFAYKSGTFTNITPFKNENHVSLGADPLSFASGSTTMTIAYTAHGLTTSDYITISGAEEQDCVASGIINTRFKVASVPTADTLTVTLSSSATHAHNNVGGSNITLLISRPTITLGANAIALTNASTTATITYNSHGLSVGDRISIMGVSTFGGVTADTYMNIEHIVKTVTTNTFTITLGAAATSTTTGGTGAGICTPIDAGNTNQGAAYGYGMGLYGAGIYGAEIYSTDSQSFPRIVSYGRFGDYVALCFGDYVSGDGQKIYLWNGDTNTAPQVMLDAPTDCNWVDVINNQVVALCGRTLKIGQTDPLTGYITWSSYGYYENPIQNVWKVVSSCSYGDKTAILFNPTRTPDLLTYVGGDQLWDVVEITGGEAAIAPLAHCTMNGIVYYMGASGQLYAFNGSSIDHVENKQCGDYVARDINMAQAWKVHMMADPYYSQVWVFYPSVGSSECDKYMIAHRDGHFTLGNIARSATQRPSVIDDAFYMVDGSTIYRHYTGEDATHSWSATSALQNFDDQMGRFGVSKFIMDGNQSGSATLTMYGAEYPRETPSDFGSDTVTSSTEYVSVKAAGKYIGYGFSGSSDFTLGEISIEVDR